MGRPKKAFPPQPAEHEGKKRVWWNGRWHHLGAADDPARWKAEYARLLQLWAHGPTAVPHRPDDYLVATLCRDYLAADVCPPSRRYDMGRAVEMLLEAHLETAVAEFDAPALAAFQATLCRAVDDRGRKVYSVSSVRKGVADLRRNWRWGVATKRVPVERYQELLTVEGPRVGVRPNEARPAKRVTAADPKAVEATLPFLRPPVRAMVQLQLLAGFRPSELYRLTPGQVHRSGVVEIPEVGEVDLGQLGIWVYLPVDAEGRPQHKTVHHGKPRWVVLGAKARAVLAPFLERGPDVPCFSPRESLADLRREQRTKRKSKVQPSQLNRSRPGAKLRRDRYARSSYLQAVKRAAKRAGVTHWTPYQLRHRHAVDVDAVLGLDAAQAALGHTSPQTTRRYSKQSFTRAAEVARMLG